MQKKKGILVVSFGTSHEGTRLKTIVQIEKDIEAAFSEYQMYQAFTSKMIINIMKKRDGIHINTVTEAAQQMLADEIEEVIVQPTHIINGMENDEMIRSMSAFKESFKSIRFGEPLLNTAQDYQRVVSVLGEHFPKEKDYGVVLMGHGSFCSANACYGALDDMFKKNGYDNVHVATIEAYPHIDDVLKQIAPKKYRKILLMPFMVVAGEHAKEDMIGEKADSWINKIKYAGYEADYILKGLGEYSKIRQIYVDHIGFAKSF